jgi:hypothetical protein
VLDATVKEELNSIRTELEREGEERAQSDQELLEGVT